MAVRPMGIDITTGQQKLCSTDSFDFGNKPNLVNTTANFASANVAGIFITGRYYDNCAHSSANGTVAPIAQKIDLAPLFVAATINIDRLGASVSTASGVASSYVKIYLYGSDVTTGWPSTLLYESSEMDANSTGAKVATVSITLTAGYIYWVGWSGSTNIGTSVRCRSVAVAGAYNLGLSGNTASNYQTILRSTGANDHTTPPSPWVFDVAQFQSNVTPPSIRFRVA